jgi:hypothetical protein
VCVRATDLNGDGRPDLAITAYDAGQLVNISKLSRDCNANGVDDPRDVALGTSPDCNANGVPDECDLAPGQPFDCDANGLIDSCEIAANGTLDINHNGILDRCDVAGVPYCFGDGTGAACPCDPGQAGLPGHGCSNSAGTGGRLQAAGVASVATDLVTLHATGLSPSTTGLFFQGNLQQNGPFGAPFGDGLLCVNQSVKRLGVRSATNGVIMFGHGVLGDPSIAAMGQVPASGATRFYQLWFRDAASFCTPAVFNLTNGVRIDWTP